MKINLRESLNKLDLATDNKYDLRNTYDCSKISDDKKKKLAEALDKNASAKTISEILNESYDGYDYYIIEFFVDGRRYEEEYTDTSAKEALERFKEDYSDDDYKIKEIYKLTGEGYTGLGYPFIRYDESLTEANYGGAYDIDPEMFWTKDDLIEFSDAVCDKLTEKFGYQYDIADVGAESNNDMYILIEDTTHGIEADVSFRIKMSRIRAPRDLMKYLDTVVSEFVNKFEEEYQYYDFDESLKEDYDDFDPKYDARYEVNAYYGSPRRGNYAGLEDDFYTDDFEEVKDWVWEKCQKGLYINVVDRENGNQVNINTENYDFESDDAYRVFDDLEELSPLHESLNEDLETVVKSTLSYRGFDDKHGYSFDFITDRDGNLKAQLSDGLDWKDYELIKKSFRNTGIDVYQGKEHKDGGLLSIVFEPESLTEDISKPDFVVGFYAGPVDDYTLELVNPKKIAQVDVSADELRAKYGKTVDKLLNDYTSQTVDKLKSTNSWLKALILNLAEEKARKTGKLDDEFRNEERKFLETGIYMEKRLEEINYPFRDGIKDLSKKLGKMLLPKRENLNGSLKESKSIKNTGDYEVTLHYDDIGDGKEYDYTLGYDEVVDYLKELAWANGDGPEDLNEDEYLEWVMDNFDELADKYELNVLNYFESKASQYEYDHRYDEP